MLGSALVARKKALALFSHKKGYYESLRSEFFRDLWEKTAEDVGAKLEDLEDGYLRFERKGATTFVNRSDVMLDSRLVLNIAGHKPLVYKILAEVGAPDVRHLTFDLSTLRAARCFLEDTGRLSVVKPAVAGSAGGGVTTSIDSGPKLRRAAIHASGFGPRLLLEEQIEGDSFRLLYLNGRLIDAIRRDRPSVVGDGRSTIRELVRKENERRMAGEVVSLHPLSIDLEMRFFLASIGRSLGDVPAESESVPLKRAVNQNSRFENFCVRNEVHPTIVDLGATIVGALGVELAGIDMITPDVTRPLTVTGGVINEVNTTPGLQHHYLVSNSGESSPVAAEILEYLLTRRMARS